MEKKFKALDSEKFDQYMKNSKNADKYIREIAKDFVFGKETVRLAMKKLGYTRKKGKVQGEGRNKSKRIKKNY